MTCKIIWQFIVLLCHVYILLYAFATPCTNFLFLFTIACFTLCLQLVQKDGLREGLAGLPAPKNDYEIVIPDQEGEGEVEGAHGESADFQEDQADLDARREEELAKQSKNHL